MSFRHHDIVWYHDGMTEPTIILTSSLNTSTITKNGLVTSYLKTYFENLKCDAAAFTYVDMQMSVGPGATY